VTPVVLIRVDFYVLLMELGCFCQFLKQFLLVALAPSIIHKSLHGLVPRVSHGGSAAIIYYMSSDSSTRMFSSNPILSSSEISRASVEMEPSTGVSTATTDCVFATVPGSWSSASDSPAWKKQVDLVPWDYRVVTVVQDKKKSLTILGLYFTSVFRRNHSYRSLRSS
jgi:hypothetical protein